MTFDPLLMKSHSYVWLCPSNTMCKFHNKFIKVCWYSPKKVNDPKGPLHDLWAHISWGHFCNSTQRLMCPTIIRKYINEYGYSDPVKKKKKKKKKKKPQLTRGQWPQMPFVTLPKDRFLSKSHGNTSMYMYTVINFVNWPLHTHTAYKKYIHAYVQNEWSHSLFLN